jgi:tetratricopeptide (TPR) repeat protein
MSNIIPSKPSFVFGYWRPWKENSNLFDSYLNYSRDTSLVKYGADTVGQYINQASKEQVKAINQLGQVIGRGMNVLSNQMSDINETLIFLNRNMDVQIEQQKLSNLLLQNIAELLRVPDSEKERQHSIELGIKFFVNASKDEDLYADALEELLKAESLMKQDYFVLHRIGCIYLYAEKYINPEKALEYFLRAAKYASVESDIKAARLAKALTKNFNTVNSEINNSEKQIGLLAADSYEKAAFAAYILGKFSDAVNYQSKALKFNAVAQYRFLLAKYQVRNGEISAGIKNLDQCIDKQPIFAIASFKEIDLINEPEVLNLISNKNQEIENEINKLRVRWEKVESTKAANVIKELTELSQKSYEIKISQFKAFEKKANEINENIGATESEIDALITQIRETKFCTLDGNALQLLIDELLKAKNLPLEKMLEVLGKIKKQVDADTFKIGSKYAGGIVIYIDKSGNHGLVCAEKDFGEAVWGSEGKIEAYGDVISNGHGMRYTKKIVEHLSWYIQKGFFSTTKTPAPTAARLCLESNHNGFSDWYLPTLKELELMYQTYKKNNLRTFQASYYWSSSESGDSFARYINFNTGEASFCSRNMANCVRAVRAFNYSTI